MASAATPPKAWIIVLPPKSINPKPLNHPLPNVQWTIIGYNKPYKNNTATENEKNLALSNVPKAKIDVTNTAPRVWKTKLS